MSWQLFEPLAAGYEAWYAQGRGARASAAEQALLARLLSLFPGARSALEIGCGTGHFTRWLAERLAVVVGLDRSRAMLLEARRQASRVPLLEAEARRLPLRDGSVDLVVLVTALEFLDAPGESLAEAVRGARQGLVLVVLNRWSAGGLSRRWGRQARKPILRHAQDYALRDLRETVARAAGSRLERMIWQSAVFPGPLWRVQAPVPFGGSKSPHWRVASLLSPEDGVEAL
jgi:ubiquinone/menaquinone biosynthesis C-methylase UbiE